MFNLFPIIETLIGQANKFIFIYNYPTNTLSYKSSSLEGLWGQDFNDIIGSYIEILSSITKQDTPFVEDMFKQFTCEAFNDTVEFSIVMEDKTLKHISCNVSSLANDKGQIEWITGELEDISRRKKLEKNVFDYTAKKNTALEVLEHDLGGQLSLLKNIASSFTEENIKSNLGKLVTYAESIQELSKSSMELIADLLKVEYQDTSNTPIRKVRVNIVTRINSILTIFKSSKNSNPNRFILNSSKEEIFIEVDDVKFMQVLNNIIYNSMKFSGEDGIIVISIEDNDKSVLFSVQDNGIGIPEELQDKVFEEHTMAGRLGLKGEKTTGIGLSIAKRMVELHKGNIWFKSSEGKGTTFYIEIPKKNMG